MDGLGKTTLQSGIRIDEVVHLVSITSHDTNELTTVILQSFQQRIYCLATEGVVIS